MDLLSQITERLQQDTFPNYAKKHKTQPNNIRVLIYNEKANIKDIEPKYGILHDNILEKASFGEILDITYIMRPLYTAKATPYIMGFMQRKCSEYNISPTAIKLHIATSDNAQTLKAYLFNNDKQVKELPLAEILEKK